MSEFWWKMSEIQLFLTIQLCLAHIWGPSAGQLSHKEWVGSPIGLNARGGYLMLVTGGPINMGWAASQQLFYYIRPPLDQMLGETSGQIQHALVQNSWHVLVQFFKEDFFSAGFMAMISAIFIKKNFQCKLHDLD